MPPEELPRQPLFQLVALPGRPENFEALEKLRPQEPGEEGIDWVTVWYSQVVAACAREELSMHDASYQLLKQAWDDERVDMELDPPHFYGATGVLGIDTLRSIERAVWE
jgi:hypothetical protein